MKKKSLIGLDIGSKFVKAIEFTDSKEGISITGFNMAEVSPETDIKDVIRPVISEGKFHTKRVATAVSGRSVIVRYISMQRMPVNEIKDALKYEAEKYVPFDISEAILDYQLIEQALPQESAELVADKEMRIILVAVKKNTVYDHIRLLEECGLIPTVIDVDAFALGNAFELHELLNPEPTSAGKVSALIDIGAYKTNINILDGLNLSFTREIYIAGGEFTEAIAKKLNISPEEAENLKKDAGEKLEDIQSAVFSIIDDLSHEIHLSFDYFENQFDRSIERIYISGGSGFLVPISESIENLLDIRPLQWDPTEFLNMDETNININELKSVCAQLPIAVGLAYRVKTY